MTSPNTRSFDYSTLPDDTRSMKRSTLMLLQYSNKRTQVKCLFQWLKGINLSYDFGSKCRSRLTCRRERGGLGSPPIRYPPVAVLSHYHMDLSGPWLPPSLSGGSSTPLRGRGREGNRSQLEGVISLRKPSIVFSYIRKYGPVKPNLYTRENVPYTWTCSVNWNDF